MGCDPGPSYNDIMRMQRLQREAEAKGVATDIESLRKLLPQADPAMKIRVPQSQFVGTLSSYDWVYPPTAAVISPEGVYVILPDSVMEGYQHKALMGIVSALGLSSRDRYHGGVSFRHENEELATTWPSTRTLGELLKLLEELPGHPPLCVWDPASSEAIPTDAQLNYCGDLVVKIPDLAQERQQNAARARVRSAIGCKCD